MPTINLSGPLNFTDSVTFQDDNAISRYFQAIPELYFASSPFIDSLKRPIGDAQLAGVSTTLDFDRQVKLGPSASQITIDPDVKAAAAINIAIPDKDAHGQEKETGLFSPDIFRDPINMEPGQRYVSFQLRGTVDPSVTFSHGDLTFGFAASTSLSLTSYSSFDAAGGITLLEALRTTIAHFQIPGDASDLKHLRPGAIALVEGTGSLKLTASFKVQAYPNPLVTTSIAGPVNISVKAGPAVSVNAAVSAYGGYQVRAYKTKDSKIRIGIANKSGSEWDLSVRGSVEITAKAGNTDLIAEFFQSVAGEDAKVSKDDLRKAGLADSEIAAVENTIKAGISRSVAISLQEALCRKQDGSDAFLFEIEEAALDYPAVSAAVNRFLDGDLTGVTGDALPAGIKLIHHVLNDAVTRGSKINVNLLGIWNFTEDTTVKAAGQVFYDEEKGEVSIADSGTATTVAASLVNGARKANSDGLRSLLFSSAVATACYKKAGLALTQTLGITVRYFHQEKRPNPADLREELNLGAALLAFPAAQVGDKAHAAGAGNTLTCNATLVLDDAGVNRFFAPANDAKTLEAIGRQALAALFDGVAGYEIRKAVITREDAWKAVSEHENGIGPALRLLDPPIDPGPFEMTIYSDFKSIQAFANRTIDCANAVRSLADYLSQHKPDSADHAFTKRQKALTKALADLSANLKGHFAQEPSGLIALFLASGHPAAKAQFSLISGNSKLA